MNEFALYLDLICFNDFGQEIEDSGLFSYLLHKLVVNINSNNGKRKKLAYPHMVHNIHIIVHPNMLEMMSLIDK